MTWSERIRELQAVGWTLQEIADHVGLTKSAIGDLAVGRNNEPRFEAGKKLDALYRRQCSPAAKRRRARWAASVK